jgi:hypothetical protein
MPYPGNNASDILLVRKNLYTAEHVYPTRATWVTVTATASAWTLGNYAEIVPINTITSQFCINKLNVGAVSAATYYEVVIFSGTTEIGRTHFYTSDSNYGYAFQDFKSPLIAANSQIQAKLATASGGADTVVMSISYNLVT